MKTSIFILLSGLWLSEIVAAAAPADGPGYQLEFLPGLSEPSVGIATKINAAGQIAGWSLDTNGNPRAVRWDPHPGGGYCVQDLGTLGGAVSWAYGLNDHGDVVGAAMIETGEEYAFVWQKGKMVNLGASISTPPLPHGWRTLSQANAINNAGQVVGWSVTDKDEVRAFLWQESVMTELEPVAVFGNQLAAAQDINNRGDVVGWSITGIGEGGAVRWSKGQATQLGPDAGFAYAINARGQIAGLGQGPVEIGAFLWNRGAMIRSGVESVAFGLNDSGHAVGSYLSRFDSNIGQFLFLAFIWRGDSFQSLPYSVPERSSYAHSINNRGQVVGFVVGLDWFSNPVLWMNARE